MCQTTVFRKRKSAAAETSADNTSTGKRPCVNGIGDVDSVATHDNTDEDCVDDKQVVRNTMIVRLPTQAPNAPPSSIIVIDDSDDDTHTPTDVKPDVQQLDQQLVESSAGNVDSIDHKPPPPYSMIDQQTNHIAPEHTASEGSPPECSRQMSVQQSVAGAGIGSSQASSYSRSSVENVQTSEHSRPMLGHNVAGAGIGNSQACSASRRNVENTPMLVQSVGGAGGRNAWASSSHGAGVSIQTPENSRQMFGQSAASAGSGNLQASSSRSAVEDVGAHGTPSRPQRRLSKSTHGATVVQNQKAADKSSSEKSTASKRVQTEISRQEVSIQTEAGSGSAEGQLESLRSNVLQLLKTIVPTLTCSNLEFVDELVVEMVRVNAENGEVDS